jgi:hypothetical protein
MTKTVTAEAQSPQLAIFERRQIPNSKQDGPRSPLRSVHLRSNSRGRLHRADPRKRHQTRHLVG